MIPADQYYPGNDMLATADQNMRVVISKGGFTGIAHILVFFKNTLSIKFFSVDISEGLRVARAQNFFGARSPYIWSNF